jgi:hypothetical protein
MVDNGSYIQGRGEIENFSQRIMRRPWEIEIEINTEMKQFPENFFSQRKFILGFSQSTKLNLGEIFDHFSMGPKLRTAVQPRRSPCPDLSGSGGRGDLGATVLSPGE